MKITEKILVEKFGWDFHPRFGIQDPSIYKGKGTYIKSGAQNIGFKVRGLTASEKYIQGKDNDWKQTVFFLNGFKINLTVFQYKVLDFLLKIYLKIKL